jgi:hypothetical protein
MRRVFDLIEIPNAYARLQDGSASAMLGLETFTEPVEA